MIVEIRITSIDLESTTLLIDEKRKTTHNQNILIKPLLPNGTICSRIVKILFKKKVGIIEKIYYERHDYESVDEKRLS